MRSPLASPSQKNSAMVAISCSICWWLLQFVAVSHFPAPLRRAPFRSALGNSGQSKPWPRKIQDRGRTQCRSRDPRSEILFKRSSAVVLAMCATRIRLVAFVFDATILLTRLQEQGFSPRQKCRGGFVLETPMQRKRSIQDELPHSRPYSKSSLIETPPSVTPLRNSRIRWPAIWERVEFARDGSRMRIDSKAKSSTSSKGLYIPVSMAC